VGEEAVFGSLLADGAGTGLFAPAFVFEVDFFHPVDEEAVVVEEEAPVFGYRDSVDEVGGYIVEPDVVAFETDGAVGVFGLFDKTLHHEGGEWWIDDGAEEYLDQGEPHEGEEGDPAQPP